MKTQRLPDWVRYPLLILALAACYFVVARLSLLLQLPGTNASPVWPPSGIGAAALLLLGLRAWPGVAAGAFLANLLTLPQTTAGLCAASAIATGNTLEAVVALLVMRRLVPSLYPFDHPHDVFRFLVSVVIACAVASTTGATSLWLTGIIGGHLYTPVWFTWWLGDSAGIIVLVPAIVCWSRPPRLGLSEGRWLELTALAVTTAFTAELTFGGWFPVAVPFLVVAGPLWAAFRFGPRETSLLPVLLSVITITHVWQWSGKLAGSGSGASVYIPFVSGAAGVNNSLLMLQLFVCAVGVTAIILAAAVAERNQTEDRLRDSEARFRTIFEQAAVGAALIDTATGRFVRVNRRYGHLIGYSVEEMTRTTFMALSHPDDLQHDLDQMKRLIAGEIGEFTMEKRLFRKDGSEVWVNLTVSPTWHAGETPEHHIAIVEDITGRKLAEAERQKFVSLADNSPEFIGMCDSEFQPFYVNAAGQKMVGLRSLDEACRVRVQDYFFPEDRPWVTDEFFPRVLRDGHGEVEIRFRHFQTGEPIWMLYNVFNIKDTGGAPIGWATVSRNIHARKVAEAAMRASEERFRLLTDALPHMVWTMRPDLTLEYLNRRASEFTGYSVERANREGWQHLVHPDDLPGMLATVSGPLERGEPHEAEYRFRRHTGEYRRVISTAVPVKDETGRVTQWIGSTLDIHDRWLAERQFRLAVEASPSAIIMSNRDGRIVLVNALTERMFGYSREELLGAPIELLVPESVRAKHPGLREAFFANPTARAMGAGRDLYGQRKDGSRFPVEIGLNPIDSADGMLALAAVVDITARARAEEQFRIAVESSPSGMVMIDSTGRIKMVNRLTEQLFGYDRAELLGQPVEVLLPERYRARHPEAWSGFFARPTVQPMGVRRDLWGRRKDGTEFPVEIGLNPVQLETGWHALASVIDISSRRAAEQVLRASEAQFRQLADAMPQIVWAARPDGCLDYYNRKWYELTGAVEGATGDQSWLPILHPADRQKCFDIWYASVQTGQPYQIEYRFRFPDTNEYRWQLGRALPVRDEEGRIIRWYGTCTDVDDQKRLEEQLRELNVTLEQRVEERTHALREEEERFRSAFDHAPIGIALVAPDGRWLRVNLSLCEIVGYTEAELLASDIQTITHPDDLEADLGQMRDLLSGKIRTYQMEKRYFHKKGHVVHILLSVSLVRDVRDVPLHLIKQIQDVTDRKLAEERVKISLREKEVLLSEIHHRVKNNLQIISTLLDLQSDYTKDQLSLEMFKESRGRVRSMALIHERLYRSQDLAHVNFNEYVRQLAEDLYRTYKVSEDEIELRVQVDVLLLPIDIAIPCGLLLNELMSNCLKHGFAKPSSGGWIRVTLRSDGHNNVLMVADNGAGFPPGVDFRKPTSFGLQLVNALVRQVQGEITLNTDRGSEFIVTFPATNHSHNGTFP